jgi:hypothetical protein
MGELLKNWGHLTDRFGNSDGGWVTTLLGVAQPPAPQLLVMLEATAVD